MTDNFKGPTAKGFDDQHFYDNHHPDGKGAKTPGAKKNLFSKKWTQKDIAASVRRAWAARKKIIIMPFRVKPKWFLVKIDGSSTRALTQSLV